jgi:hypothetical protein
MEYYSVLERNELSSHGKSQRNPKGIFLSVRSQSKSDILEKVKLWRQLKDQWLPGIWKEGGIDKESTENF